MALPLTTDIRPFIFAETDRLAGEHHHRHLLVQRGAHRHGGMNAPTVVWMMTAGSLPVDLA